MSNEGARRPKSELADSKAKKRTPKAKATAAGQAKKASKTKVPATGQAKKATKVKATAKTASKTAAKQAVSAAVKMPVSSLDLKHARRRAQPEVAMGTTAAKKEEAALPSRPEVDLPDQIDSGPSEEITVLIQFRAYELWEQRGREHGRALEDWLDAENEIADALFKAAGTRPGKTTRVLARRKVK